MRNYRPYFQAEVKTSEKTMETIFLLTKPQLQELLNKFNSKTVWKSRPIHFDWLWQEFDVPTDSAGGGALLLWI